MTDGSAFVGNVFAQQVKDVPDFTHRSGRHCRLGRQAGRLVCLSPHAKPWMRFMVSAAGAVVEAPGIFPSRPVSSSGSLNSFI